jgi:hypothetical protein
MSYNNLSQTYLAWLYGALKSGALGDLGDPDDSGGGWFNNPSQAYQIWTDAQQIVGSESNQSSWPFIMQFMQYYQQYQETFPSTGLPVGAEFVIPNQLVRLSDGTYTDANLNPVNADTAAQMLQSYLGQIQESGGEMTEYQHAQVQQAINELAWQKQYQTAQLGLTAQEQQIQYNQYLAGLAAQPANWIERWFAEKLAPGTPYQLASYNTPMTLPGVTIPTAAGTTAGTPWVGRTTIPGGATTPTTPAVASPTYQLGTPQNPLTPDYGPTGDWVMQQGPPLSAYPVEVIYAALKVFSPELGDEWAARRAQEIKYGVEWGVTQPIPADYVQPTNLPAYVETSGTPEQNWATTQAAQAAQGITPETGVGLIGGAQPISTQSELDAYLANAAATGQW